MRLELIKFEDRLNHLYRKINKKWIKDTNQLKEIWNCDTVLEKEGYCYKMYYDIDLYINKADITDYNNKLKDFIKVIANIYKEFDENFNKAEIIELDASRDSIDEKYKLVYNKKVLPSFCYCI